MNKAKAIFLVCALLLTVVLTGCSAKETADPIITPNPTVPSVTVPPVVTTPSPSQPATTITPLVPSASPTAEATSPEA